MIHPPVLLPVDNLLPSIVEILRAKGTVVIEAPPGAGKTTRVPRAILEAGLAGDGEILVLEPRRLAARMAGRRVAAEVGEPVGETVGYQVRYEDVSGPRTRLKFITEGVMVRRLAADPALRGVGAVVLDEFHERHLHGDLTLALLRRLRENGRRDLKLVVMSATLDAAPVAEWLGAPIVRSEGRRYDVAVEYLTSAEAADRNARIEVRVVRAVRRLVDEGTSGHILVFLPGMAEIRRSMEACAAFAGQAGLDLVPLHGDLSPGEQDRAVLPASRPKVIFATNVAETSVTIDGVTAVVDTGLARVASHSPWTGLPRLELRKISRASATQRAGRAGRTSPGRAIRLYSEFDHDMRPGYELPEILREDLAETVLLTASLGASDLMWLDPPPEAALAAARSLLARMGAIDESGMATALGRTMLRFPLHPRLARFVIEANARGAGQEGALAAALISERNGRGKGPGEGIGAHSPNGSSDLLEWLRHDSDPEGQVSRARQQIAALLPKEGTVDRVSVSGGKRDDVDEAILAATLAAFSDRLGRRRDPGGDEIVLAGGGSARVAADSVVRNPPLLVAVDVEERVVASRSGAPSGKPAATIRLASAVTPEMLLDLFPDRLLWEESATWNEHAERVEGWEKLSFDGLVLESSRKQAVEPEKAAVLLATAARAKGVRAFAPDGAIDRLLSRMAFVAEIFLESAPVPFTKETMEEALTALCVGRKSFAELGAANLADVLVSGLPGEGRAFLDRMAPEWIRVRAGRSVKVHYEGGGKTPHIESRLQDFFGEKTGAAIGGGRVPLVIHLLAPNMRAVQVTSDLAGFWQRHYPSIRKELMRRYPKHDWPENPLVRPGGTT